MEQLNAFLMSRKSPDYMFAQALDISRGHLSDIKKGKKRPSLDLIFLIETVTLGAVPVSSWARQPQRKPRE